MAERVGVGRGWEWTMQQQAPGMLEMRESSAANSRPPLHDGAAEGLCGLYRNFKEAPFLGEQAPYQGLESRGWVRFCPLLPAQ